MSKGSKMKKLLLKCGIPYECSFCRAKEGKTKRTKLTVDHILPKHFGGLHTVTNAQFLCWRCHLKKTTMENKRLRDRGFASTHRSNIPEYRINRQL